MYDDKEIEVLKEKEAELIKKLKNLEGEYKILKGIMDEFSKELNEYRNDNRITK